MLVIIDPYPTHTGVVRTENTANTVNLCAGVKSNIALTGSGHPETDVICLLYIRQPGKTRAKVCRMPQTIGAALLTARQPDVAASTGNGFEFR